MRQSALLYTFFTVLLSTVAYSGGLIDCRDSDNIYSQHIAGSWQTPSSIESIEGIEFVSNSSVILTFQNYFQNRIPIDICYHFAGNITLINHKAQTLRAPALVIELRGKPLLIWLEERFDAGYEVENDHIRLSLGSDSSEDELHFGGRHAGTDLKTFVRN